MARHEALLDGSGVMHSGHHHLRCPGRCVCGGEPSGAILVDDSSTAIASLDEAGEDILARAVSDEALEAAGGYRPGERFTLMPGPTDCRCC
jgi:hypothetical protein